MNLRRLALVADAVEAAPEEEFLMECWVSPRSLGSDVLDLKCGFVGCAVGHLLKGGPVEGLRLRQVSVGDPFVPMLDDLSGYLAVAAWLETTERRTIHLLSPTSYRFDPLRGTTRAQALSRLRDALASEEALT